MSDMPNPAIPPFSAPPAAPPPPPAPVGYAYAEAPASPHAEVLEELQRLQTHQRSWKAAVLILLVSLALFVGAGSTFWDMEFVLLLIPILLFHELGHYIAMRLFGYRNLRMLFLPLLGAAVTGQHFNVPGWKKTIVSLMGPLPGIAVGIVLGIAAIIIGHDLLLKAALLTLILNAFNLLPVLPLDGGWVMHSLLFSRHWMLDVIFRAVAAAALLAAGFIDRIFLFLGIFMLIGVPLSYKLGRIAEQVRREGLPPVSPDDQNIPLPTAEAIIEKVKQAYPMGQNNKTIAQHTLNVFETVNARPPGWLATIGLGGVWGMSLLVSIVFGMVFIVAQRGDLLGFLRAAAFAPQHALAPEAIRTWQGDAATAAVPRHTIVAGFASDAEAEAAYVTLLPDLPPQTAAGLFGRTVMVAVPAEDESTRRHWFDYLQDRTSEEVFVDGPGMAAALSISCIAPNDAIAAGIERQAQNYLSLPAEMHLLPPWAADDPRTDAQRRQHDLARQTYQKLQSAYIYAFEMPEYEEMIEKMSRAQRAGERGQVEQLRAEQAELLRKARADSLHRVLEEAEGEVDHALARRYIELIAGVEDDKRYEPEFLATLNRELGPMMGQLPLDDEANPVAGSTSRSTQWGSAAREGLMLTMYWVTFADLLEGAPALVGWLDEQGCMGFRYDIHPQHRFDDAELEYLDW